MANIMNSKTKYLIGKWNKRISLVEKNQGKALTYEQRAALANTLENTADKIRVMEATNPGSVGQYKRYALDLITATVPNLIAFDVMAVQAMDNRIGMINYVDFRYSKAKGSTEAGQVFNSALNMGPSDTFYTSNLVKDEIIGTGDGATTQFSNIALPWYPVIPRSFLVECDGVIGVADEQGAIKGTGVSGTITAGRVVNLTFTTAPASGKDIVVTYTFDNESVNSDGPEAAGFTNVPEFELKINTMPVEAKARTLRTYWAFDAQYELQKEYGTDIEALLATQAAGEIAAEIDQELTGELLTFANAAAPLTWSRTMIPGTSSLVDHYESFLITLNEGKNRIMKATRKKKGNFLICGNEVATVLESCRTFKPSNIDADGPHYIGEVAGLKCYYSPNYPDNEFVIGYKGNNMFEAGAFYCPYMPLSSTSVIMDANFRGQEAWATMYGKAFLNSQLYIKGAITD